MSRVFWPGVGIVIACGAAALAAVFYPSGVVDFVARHGVWASAFCFGLCVVWAPRWRAALAISVAVGAWVFLVLGWESVWGASFSFFGQVLWAGAAFLATLAVWLALQGILWVDRWEASLSERERRAMSAFYQALNPPGSRWY